MAALARLNFSTTDHEARKCGFCSLTIGDVRYCSVYSFVPDVEAKALYYKNGVGSLPS